MDFGIAQSLQARLEQARELVDREIPPIEAMAAAAPFSELAQRLQPVRARVKELGLWAPHVPQEHGGAGLRLLEFALLGEQLGRSPFGHYAFNCQAPDAGNMEVLLEFGTEEQKREWLAPLVRGECRSCFAMTEPERPGSNPVWMETTAARRGDHYLVNGHKWFTTAADGARFAIVMAVTNPQAPPHERASLLIVPTDSPGFVHVRNIPCMGHSGDGWASHAELRFEDCRVPVENRLGAEGAGFAMAQARLGRGRIHHCMRWLGVCERSFDLLCQRAASREIAPGEWLGSRQTVQNWIAESRAEMDAARWLVLHTAWSIDTRGIREAREAISAIKFHVARVMLDVIDRAIQVHGALGMTEDTVLSWFYRQERGARIYDGPDEVHKTAVARRILRRYGASV